MQMNTAVTRVLGEPRSNAGSQRMTFDLDARGPAEVRTPRSNFVTFTESFDRFADGTAPHRVPRPRA
jgi:hypothetical protein